jgi:uncharacterized protein YbgA (DUF1722 family)
LIAYAERCGMTIDQLSKKESYYGRLSWASLSSVYTFIRMQDFTTPRGFLTFIVAISERHLENTLAVLAHSREDSFDYPQAVATIKDWQALRSQKQTTKWVSALLKVLTTLTNRKEHDPAVRSFAPA